MRSATEIANEIEFSSYRVTGCGVSMTKFQLGGCPISGAGTVNQHACGSALTDSLDEVVSHDITPTTETRRHGEQQL